MLTLDNDKMEFRTAGADLEKVRTLLIKEDYEAACELLGEMEVNYAPDLWYMENREFRTDFWKLVMEAYTCGYKQYELNEEEQHHVCRSLRQLKVSGSIPIRAAKYVHDRIEYVKWGKILDFQAERKKTAIHVSVTCPVFLFALWMVTISMPCMDWMAAVAGNIAVTAFAAAYLLFMGMEIYFCLDKYRKLQKFLYHPAPFEEDSL